MGALMKTLFHHWLGLGASLVFALALPVGAEPGDLDLTFNGTGKLVFRTPGAAGAIATAIAVQRDGKIVIAGNSIFGDISPPSNSDFVVARFNPNGTPDTRLNGTGIVTTDLKYNDWASAVVIQSDGRIVVGGSSYSQSGDDPAFVLVRYRANGSLDTTFAGTGQVNTPISVGWPFGTHLALQSDGKIVLAGSVEPSGGGRTEIAVLRYHPNGTLDTTFGGTGVVTTSLGSRSADPCGVAVQPDGKIVVGGSSIARYHADGTLDTTFGHSGIVTTVFGESWVYGMALQSDGKVVLTGDAGYIAVTRYFGNGSPDLNFNGTGMVTLPVVGAGRAVAVQHDGRIVLAGTYWESHDNSDFIVARCDSVGSLDLSFHDTGFVHTDFSGPSWNRDEPTAMALQPDGKIVVCGQTILNDGSTSMTLARYIGLPAEGTAQFSAPVYVVSEKARTAVLTVQRINAYQGTLTVNYETSDGSAASGSDYVAAAGTLVFGPGQRKKTIRLALQPDQIADGGETLQVTLKSPAGYILDSTTVALRENALALSSRKLKPGQRLTVLGRFDPAQPLYVRFTDYELNDTRVMASDVTARSARVRVPVFIDPNALEIGPATLFVQAEQGDVVAGPVPNVRVADAPPTGQPPGVFALEFIKATREVCGLAERDWQAIDNQSEGGIDTSELRFTLAGMQTRLQEFEDQLQLVLDGTNSEIELGTAGAETVTLDSSGLAMLDRMLVAAVFEGKFKPSTAGLVRWRALVAQDPSAAAAPPTGTDDFADELNPKLEPKSSGVFALARRMQEIAQTGIGKAAEMAEDYLARPGPPRAEFEQGFSASTWLATVLRPALLGYTAAAEAEPVVRNESHRPITAGDLEAPVAAVHKGLVAGIRADNERLTRLGDLLGAIDRQGTLLWNWVSQSWNELDVTSSVQHALDWNDPTSAISKIPELGQVIYEHRPRPVVAIESSVTVIEPATGRRNASFLVSLSFAFDTNISVFFTVDSGSAVSGQDFAPPSGTTLTIRAGSLGGWINVPVLADRKDDETTEGFGVTLLGAMNATVDPLHAHGSGFILDARRHWTLDATVQVAGTTYPIPAVFDLPRSGGKVSVPLPGVVGKVTITQTTVTVSASGFKFAAGAKVTGGGGGSAPITPFGCNVTASGGITGNVHVLYSDGCEDDFPVTGTFTATANE